MKLEMRKKAGLVFLGTTLVTIGVGIWTTIQTIDHLVLLGNRELMMELGTYNSRTFSVSANMAVFWLAVTLGMTALTFYCYKQWSRFFGTKVESGPVMSFEDVAHR